MLFRSIGSSTRDSALDAIRGEISRLRNEIKKAKNNEKENFQPTLVSTPRAPPNRVDEPAAFSDSETLRAIRNDIQVSVLVQLPEAAGDETPSLSLSFQVDLM